MRFHDHIAAVSGFTSESVSVERELQCGDIRIDVFTSDNEDANEYEVLTPVPFTPPVWAATLTRICKPETCGQFRGRVLGGVRA